MNEAQTSARGLLNRELSWLDFDERVLALAADARVPLLERARFLAIVARNLDEFFQIRVAGLIEQRDAGIGARSADGLTAFEQLRRIRERCVMLTARAAEVLEEEVLPGLDAEGVSIVGVEDLSASERERVQRFFDEDVFPVLTPLSVDPAHPFPYVSDLSLNIAAMVIDPATEERRFARVKVPPNLGRLVRVHDRPAFLPVERIVGANLSRLFPGMHIASWDIFRVTRDADLDVLDEGDDLVEMIRSGLERRRRGARAVRLECGTGMDDEVKDLLLRELELGPNDTYDLPTLPLDALWFLEADRPDLHFPAWTPVTPRALLPDEGGDVFGAIADRDVLLHHPYDSFTGTTSAFIEAAAVDPHVVTIKQTLYRTSAQESRIIRALIRAAESGKQVVALVELKARFDEETNLGYAEALERAGVHVVYGIVGLKAHAKLALVVRREGGALRTYSHVGTGNYNAVTSRTYEDLGLLTADANIGADLTDTFNLLTGYGHWTGRHTVLLAPYELREALAALIRSQASPGGRVIMKMNSLVDPDLIEALHDVSRAGGTVDLIVRGICCLRPGVPGTSDGIRVRSIVGRFLEHSRVFRFGEGGAARHLIGSADLMPRNLDGRVEAVVPVRDLAARARIDRMLDLALRDDTFAWELDADGTWTRVSSERGVGLHRALMDDARDRAEGTSRLRHRVALVRHAIAEPRDGWTRDDRDRPLTVEGHRQAGAIARHVVEAGSMETVLSSPYIRCLETAAPIADAVGATTLRVQALAEGSTVAAALDLVLSANENRVMVTHGDIVRGVVDALMDRGARLEGEPVWSKGCVWWIEPDADGTLRLRATVPPP